MEKYFCIGFVSVFLLFGFTFIYAIFSPIIEKIIHEKDIGEEA